MFILYYMQFKNASKKNKILFSGVLLRKKLKPNGAINVLIKGKIRKCGI